MLLITAPLIANEEGEETHHHNHRHELGLVNAPILFVKQNEIAYALHVHYTHFLENSPLGIGLGYEIIFADHLHNSITVHMNYELLEHLNFDLAPGIVFEGGNLGEINYTIHTELFYEFEIGDFHLGPSFEFAYDPEDIHLSVGLHLGYMF